MDINSAVGGESALKVVLEEKLGARFNISVGRKVVRCV